MTLRADLIAVRALIDTPEKYRALKVWPAMLEHWHGDTDESDVAYAALERQVPRVGNHLRYYENENGVTHADIMALFDRAIAEAAE